MCERERGSECTQAGYTTLLDALVVLVVVSMYAPTQYGIQCKHCHFHPLYPKESWASMFYQLVTQDMKQGIVSKSQEELEGPKSQTLNPKSSTLSPEP